MKQAVKKGIVVGLGVILQFALTLLLYLFLIEKIWIVDVIYALLSVIIVVGLIRNSKNYSYTLPWIIIVLLFPLVGTLLFIAIGQNRQSSKILKSIVESEKSSKKYLKQDENLRKEISANSRLRYISNFAGYPITKNNEVKYYPLGEKMFKDILRDLKKAEKFIFLEFFIISHGTMWDSILEILKKKVREGVDVRVIYDDAGCIATLENKYYKKLESMGIKCIAFNKLNPISGVIMNNRDHRKILIIDGCIAFSGGVNISDEYININSPYGHWKDTGTRIVGDAIWNYTVMFLTMWNSFKKNDSSFLKFKYDFKDAIKENGFVAPYGETPLDNEEIGKDIYLNIINQANKYLYLTTPYLIIDSDVINALILASKRGVDVKVIIPGIPDKKITYSLTESYIEILHNGGVEIYKYTPGFVHAKVFVSDDHIATVGTLNLDYRSLYLHFECGLYLEDVKCIKDIKKDLDDTISKSHRVTKKEATPSLIKAIWQTILRLFAPLF
ncbi:MAG: cardiolipin synthase [Bacilli bacterium]|nr:cardiolipin synthase [Bacilli bacterium]